MENIDKFQYYDRFYPYLTKINTYTDSHNDNNNHFKSKNSNYISCKTNYVDSRNHLKDGFIHFDFDKEEYALTKCRHFRYACDNLNKNYNFKKWGENNFLKSMFHICCHNHLESTNLPFNPAHSEISYF